MLIIMSWSGTVLVLGLCLLHLLQVNTRRVQQFNAPIDLPDEDTLVRLVLGDRTPDRFKTDEVFERWGKAAEPRVTQWAWNSCGGVDDLVVVGNISVSPDPIKLPGTLMVSLAAKVKNDIPAPIQAELTIEKKVAFIWVKIPCIDNVGSCTYPDVCQMLNNVTCPAAIVQAGQNCRCPIKQSDGFVIQPTPFVISSGSEIPTGDYKIQANATQNGKVLVCINIIFTIAH